MPTIVSYAETLAEWRWLQRRGWKIASVPNAKSNQCDVTNKRILLMPSAYANPSTRQKRYVFVHECIHGVQGQALGGNPVGVVAKACGIDFRSAREVIADAYLLDVDRSLRMTAYIRSTLIKAWVPRSVEWHENHGYRYTMKHLRHPVTSAVVNQIEDIVRAG